MEGVVDHHMRRVMHVIGGVDIFVTEFVRVCDHTLPRKVFIKYSPELIKPQPKIPTRIQLLGSNPEALALSAKKAAKLGAPAIDLNFGCPAKTVNRNRGGACLLDDTDLIYQIVSRVREMVPPSIPVTAKIRLGYQERDSYLRNAQAIEQAGANELIVHARSKKDGYNPPAYWKYIGEIKQAVKIPVVANGEIWSLTDFIQCREESLCEDFMLGRGLLARPDLAREIKAYCQGQEYAPMPWREVAHHLHQFFLETCAAYPKKYTGNRAKQWLHYLSRHYTEAAALFESIKKTRDFSIIDTALKNHYS